MLALVIDMRLLPAKWLEAFYACISGVDADGGYMSNRIDKGQNEKQFQSLSARLALA